MPPWREAQAAFARAVVAPGLAPPAGLASAGGRVDEKRFDVYRNNVAASLVANLRATYPVVAALVGRSTFDTLARTHVAESRPTAPMLHTYGGDFADFLASQDLVGGLPYLPDVARLEWARLRAYHASDAEPAELPSLKAMPPEALPGLRLEMHPACRVVRSEWPVVAIWRAHQGDDVSERLAAVDFVPEDALVSRPGLTVAVRLLGPGAAAFVTALAQGRPLGEAAEAGAEDAAAFDLTAAIGGLFEAGAVARIDEGATRGG